MTGNPMQRANGGLALHPRCGAHCRTTGQPCRNPSMRNGRCRMHGGKSPGAPKGERNPQYKHGLRSKHIQQEWREARQALRLLRELLG